MPDPLPILDYHGRGKQPEISPQYEISVEHVGDGLTITAKPIGVPGPTGCAVGFLLLVAALLAAGALALLGMGGTATVPWITSIGITAAMAGWTAWYLLSSSRRAIIVIASPKGLAYSNRLTAFKPKFIPCGELQDVVVSALNRSSGWSLNAVAGGRQMVVIPSGNSSELWPLAEAIREAMKLDSTGKTDAPDIR